MGGETEAAAKPSLPPRAPIPWSGAAPRSLALTCMESQPKKKKKCKHILSKRWPASAANLLVRNIGIAGAGWHEHLCTANGERSWLPADALTGRSQSLRWGQPGHNTHPSPTSQCKGTPVSSPKCPCKDTETWKTHHISLLAVNLLWVNIGVTEHNSTEQAQGNPSHQWDSSPTSPALVQVCLHCCRLPPRFGVQ